MDPAEVQTVAERLERSLTVDDDDEEKCRRYREEGKEAAQRGDLGRSLELFRLAYELRPSAKLESRIQRLQEAIKDAESQEEEEEDEEFVNVNGSGLMLFKELYNKLYEHQKEGVAFLYSLHRDGRRGGILADDMGLGKTIQVISFLSGMYDAELANHSLLVMPTSLIKNWVREFAKWTPGMRVKEFHGTSKVERNRNLERIQRKGGVIITTYQMLINNWEQLATYQHQEFRWDYVILDEAHKIKTSSTKTAKSAHAIPARNRVLLTGTPVQNNLREMWALFDFACQGALLGTAKTFKTEYENPITRAREKDATPGEKTLGLKISQNLMDLIRPYFLRRTKAEVQQKKQNAKGTRHEEEENKCPNAGDSAEMPSLTRKNDLIIWTYLSEVQEDIYQQFISLDHIKALMMTTRSPLAELTVLKKLCDHPRLLSARAVTQLGLEQGAATDLAAEDNENESAAGSIEHVSDETLLEESGKLRFLVSLLEQLKADQHRTLVFSQSRKMLDIIDRVLRNRNFRLLRVDGTVTQLVERERRITLFQTDRRYSVFLLTTQVGGVGITLTAANRVVIFDPSWNPATDAQAVDRAYRIGQTENVVIYRLITCGTVEEKIYRRQVFKDSLIRQTTGDKKNPFRYFSKQELKELFTLEDTRSSSTQLQLQALHSQHRRSDARLDSHIAELHRMEMFGISDHDLMFSKEDAAEEDDPQDAEADLYIQNRVQKAQELVQAESELHGQLMESVANSTEPAWLRLAKQREVEEHGSKERGKRTPMQSPPAVVDLTQSGSEELHDLSYADEVEIISEDGEVEVKSERLMSDEVIDLSDQVSVNAASAESLVISSAEDHPQHSEGEDHDNRTKDDHHNRTKDNLAEDDHHNRTKDDHNLAEDDHRNLAEDDHRNLAEDDHQNLAEDDHHNRTRDDHNLAEDEHHNLAEDEHHNLAEDEHHNRTEDEHHNRTKDDHNLAEDDHRNLAEDDHRNLAEDDHHNLAEDDHHNRTRDDHNLAEDEHHNLAEDEHHNRTKDNHNHAEDDRDNHAEDDHNDHTKDYYHHTEDDRHSHTEDHHHAEDNHHAQDHHTEVLNTDHNMSQGTQEMSLQEENNFSPVMKEDQVNMQLFSVHASPPDQSDPSQSLLEPELNASNHSVQMDSFQGKFNLELEDSADMFSSEEKEQEEEEMEEEEGVEMEPSSEEGNFQLQMELSGEASAFDFPVIERSALSTPANDSVNVVRKKKKAQMICDSEEEEEEEEEEKEEKEEEQEEKPLLGSSPLTRSFKNLGSSTPKTTLNGSAPRRQSMNTSVASRRSFVESFLEDLEEDEDDDAVDAELSQASESSRTSYTESVEEEEPSGETLDSENTRGSEGVSRYESCAEEESVLEESTGDVELSSGEALEQYAPKSVSKAVAIGAEVTNNTSPLTFEALVHSGKSCLAEGKKQEALDLFLKAIDINSGDGEIQLLIIQLYRQLSQQ
ncbi:DNA excision repair protein ERCC-6-like isoform X2 [Astyanax mexicanus]|uniref:DNA excision repair protein ERCC-6-like isoform X2 n=1 Tax=Astyanax mexicanus TaxID=7994 RepID=UPI0020CACB02|nr:DNA excision repair protein ERCC-6-like isoform X2 [Astyanax mexicanus]